MQFKKSLLTLAVAVALTPLSALATLNLDNGVGGAVYAKQIKLTPPLTVISQNITPTALQATGTLGVGTPANQTVYFRFDLGNGATFAGPPTFISPPDSVPVVPVPVLVAGGAGSGFVVFSTTPSVIAANFPIGGTFTLTANILANQGVTVVNHNPVPLQYRLFAIIGSALNPGLAPPADTLESKTGPFITFADGIALTPVTPYTTIADVESVPPAFNKFLAAPNVVVPGLVTANLGDATLAAQPVLLKDGTPNANLSQLAAPNSNLLVRGNDFSARAAGGVTRDLLGGPLCTGAPVVATGITNSLANFLLVAGDLVGATLAQEICYTVTGATAIPASVDPHYTVEFAGVAVDPVNYDPVNLTAVYLGRINRNGTELQATVAQYPPGFSGRIFLSNSGTVDAPYTTRFLPDVGTTAGPPGPNATGVIPAGKHILVDVSKIFTVTAGPPRGSIIVNVGGPNTAIQGAYQLFNGNNGSLSNMGMVRPGTN
jgi:hypothetical protein